MSGGTDSHLILVDLTAKNITGKAAEAALDRAGVTCNKNAIPFDPRSPFVTSGIRLGTPALTTRGMGPMELRQVAPPPPPPLVLSGHAASLTPY